MADPDLLMPQFASWQKKEIELWLKKNGFPEDKIRMLFKVGLESGALLLNEVLLPNKEKLQEYLAPIIADFPQIWIDAFWMQVTNVRKQLNDPESVAQSFARLMVQNSTSAFKRLVAEERIEITHIDLADTSSSSWRTIKPNLPPIDKNDKHIKLVEKVKEMLGLWAKSFPKLRYWVDQSKHEKGQIYPDATISTTPTKKSDFRQLDEMTDTTKTVKDPHDELEWNRPQVIIEVVNVKEFDGLDKMTLDRLRGSTLSKKVAQAITYMLRNMALSQTHIGYGAVTCYSHWLFIKGQINNGNEALFSIHDEVLPLTDNTDNRKPSALHFLQQINNVVLKAAAEPKKMYCSPDVQFTLLRLDEGGSSSFLSETIARTGRSLILTAVWPGTNHPVCIKCNQGAESFHNNEIQILKRLNDVSVPNIPRLISTGTLYRAGESYSAFVTDLIGKSIDTMLPLPVTEVRNMASDILEALTKIHERNIVHSDVKPANIIRKWNDAMNRYKYYLIDYGFSFEIGTVKDDEWGCSVEYASVEMLRGNIPTIKDDLKALWYTVMHALIGQLPWQTLRKSSELTLWYKQGWKEDLIALNQAPYTQLVNLYDNLDAAEPHEAWTKYLHAY